jgi:large subunit ribosomal protein L25
MSAIQTFSTKPRTPAGTKGADKLRKAGQVPINVSRKGQPSVSLAMDARSAELFNAKVVHLAKLDVEGQPLTVLRKEVFRNPITDRVLHIDLLAVVALANDCPGVKAGGIVELAQRRLRVKCRATQIPDYIEVDLAGVAIMESVPVSKAKLPKGVTLLTPANQVLLSVVIPRGMSLAATETPAAGADGAAAPAAGAAGAAAPAAGAAAPAAGKDEKKPADKK